jgi:hypothetical protein
LGRGGLAVKYTPGVNDDLQCQECLTGLCVPVDGNPHLVRCSECGTGMGIFYVQGTPVEEKQELQKQMNRNDDLRKGKQ